MIPAHGEGNVHRGHHPARDAMLSINCGERKVHADLSTPEHLPLPYPRLPRIGNGHEVTLYRAFMADDAESGASRSPVYNSIACDSCRQKKRRVSRIPLLESARHLFVLKCICFIVR